MVNVKIIKPVADAVASTVKNRMVNVNVKNRTTDLPDVHVVPNAETRVPAQTRYLRVRRAYVTYVPAMVVTKNFVPVAADAPFLLLNAPTDLVFVAKNPDATV